jgi:hypothetical protein
MVKNLKKNLIKEKKQEKKKGKKINKDAILIKRLLEKKIRQIDISKKFNISKQKVNYWKKTEIKDVIHRRKKLTDEEIQEIIKLAENKTTSMMGSRKIASIMNEKFKEQGKKTRISNVTVCKYLNEGLGKPRKIKRVFVTNNKKKKKGLNFVKRSLI